MAQFTLQELLTLSKDPELTPEERARVMDMLATQAGNLTPEGGLETFSKLPLREQVGGVGETLKLGSGLVPHPLVRFPGVALGTIIADMARGEGLGQTARDVVGQTALETFGPGMGKGAKALLRGAADWLPRAGLQAGLRLGGLRGDVSKAVEAFMRERGRGGIGYGVLPGTVGKVAKRRKEVGTALEAAETAAPGGVNLRQVTNPAVEKVGATKGSNPLARAEQAAENQSDFLKRGYVPGVGNVGHPRYPNVRQIGNIKREQQREASKLIESRLSGASPFDPTNVKEEMANTRAMLLKDAQEQLAPQVTPLNEHLSDLLSIQNINKSLRGGGGVVSDIGGLGIRGGFGHGIGSSIGGRTGGRLGSLAALGLLSSKGMTGAGFAAGRAAEMSPSLMRLLELYNLEHENDK